MNFSKCWQEISSFLFTINKLVSIYSLWKARVSTFSLGQDESKVPAHLQGRFLLLANELPFASPIPSATHCKYSASLTGPCKFESDPCSTARLRCTCLPQSCTLYSFEHSNNNNQKNMLAIFLNWETPVGTIPLSCSWSTSSMEKGLVCVADFFAEVFVWYVGTCGN